MVTASEISSFLSQVHAALKSHNYRILDKRQKYMSTLMQLGLIEQDVLNDLGNLTVNENWVKKTDNNPSFPGDVWICKKQLHGVCMYIKLKIQSSALGGLLVMSFHIDGI